MGLPVNNPFIPDHEMGEVFLREYDLGLVTTIGAVEINQQYYLPLSAIPRLDSSAQPPLFPEWHYVPAEVGTRMPGFPIIWVNPADAVEKYVQPCIRIRREDPSPALERWASMSLKYRCVGAGANAVTVTNGVRTLTGYDKYQEQDSAWPYDLPYTVTVEFVGKRARTHAQAVIRYLMKFLGPHGYVDVVDSLGGARRYEVFGEGPSDISIAADIRDRTIIYALSIRIQGHLDVADVRELKQIVTEAPVFGGDLMED